VYKESVASRSANLSTCASGSAQTLCNFYTAQSCAVSGLTCLHPTVVTLTLELAFVTVHTTTGVLLGPPPTPVRGCLSGPPNIRSGPWPVTARARVATNSSTVRSPNRHPDPEYLALQFCGLHEQEGERAYFNFISQARAW
jgi:hypothetical protein